MLSKSAVLSRPHWNKPLLKLFPGQPDNVVYLPNDVIRSQEYALARVELAERNATFIEKRLMDEARRRVVESLWSSTKTGGLQLV